MANLRSLQAAAFVLQVLLLQVAALVARVSVPAPAPAYAMAAPAPMGPPPAYDCTPTCEQAKKMWKEVAEAQDLAISLEKNRTAARIQAEADLLVEDVKLKVHAQGANDLNLLKGRVDSYLHGRAAAFSAAIAARHGQAVANEAKQFTVLKEHQGKLMEALMADVVDHGYQVAQTSVAQAAMAAGQNFNSNEKVQTALKEVTKAGEEWSKSYHTTEEASKEGFASWSLAYNTLNDPWNNVTGSFEKTNRAAQAARGLGPDTRWVNEVVRLAGDVAQAAHSASRNNAGEVSMSLKMAQKAAGAVKGNSGSIVSLNDMLAQAEKQANQAAMAR